MTGFELDNEQKEILLGFVEEGREMLDDVEPLLIELEQRSNQSGKIDPEVLNTIFRLFHSLKGSAGILDLKTINNVTHEAETLLDLFRKGEGSLNSEHIDLLTKTCDFVRLLLDNIEIELNDKGYENDAEKIIQSLIEMIKDLKNSHDSPDTGEEEIKATESESSETVEPEVQIDMGEMPEEEVTDEAYEAGTPDKSESKPKPEKAVEIPEDFQITITEEMVEQYVNESTELLDSAEQILLKLEKEPNNPEYISQVFRNIHSFKGNSGFFGYKDLEKLSHNVETVLDRLRDGAGKADKDLFSLLLEIIDFLSEGVKKVSESSEPSIPSLAGLISLLNEASAKIQPGSAKKKEPKKVPEPETKKAAVEEKPSPVKEDMKTEADKPEPKVEKKPVPAAAGSNGKTLEVAKRQVKPNSQHQSVRVDVEKLDIFLDLVGELVISEAMVAQNPDIKGLDISLDRFEKSVMQLEKITRNLQDLATSIRMIPLAGTFRKMIRLVRDLSQKAGKKVDLEIIGEDTEVDKTVIEQITDPLVHIVRNSLDHGLEPPEEREANGKTPTGKIILEAKYVGGEVWIQIKDDGRGLNREKILKKALERGLINKDETDIPDEQVWQMIFLPGFSTAEKITDISGRGVGMDVVKRNIEKIRGKVDVQCTPGKGSVVILRIPLTLAIIDGMIIRVGNTKYTLPIVAIRESFQVTADLITTTMDGKDIINIRGNLIPVVKVMEIFNVKADSSDLTEGIVLLIENEGKTLCLLVDEIIGQQQVVIKGLSNYVGNINYVSGCTILGDGEICLIIDVAGVIGYNQSSYSNTAVSL